MVTFRGTHTAKHGAMPLPCYGAKAFNVPVPPGIGLTKDDHIQVTVVNAHGFGSWCSVLAVEPDYFVVHYDHPKYLEGPGVRGGMAPAGRLQIHWTITRGGVYHISEE
jgi:hypothetical protein